ncbi:MAG: GNAT family protein [Anaerolineales bacterium]|nr:GNAT family protein [Anaerolineales bacterium]
MSEIDIRLAAIEDAQLIIDHVLEMIDEPDNNLLTGPGEFNYTLEQEVRYIEDINSSDNSVLFLAFDGPGLVGEIHIRGGHRKAEYHTGVLGISVSRGYRNRGIGSRLMQTCLDWAREESPLKRVELRVFSYNDAAIHVYKKFGFEIEGRRRRSIFKGGKYIDDLLMAVLLDGEILDLSG